MGETSVRPFGVKSSNKMDESFLFAEYIAKQRLQGVS